MHPVRAEGVIILSIALFGRLAVELAITMLRSASTGLAVILFALSLIFLVVIGAVAFVL